MAGSGSKKTSGISTSTSTPTTLYGWDIDSTVIAGKSGQSVIYGSPDRYQQIYGGGNNTIYVGGFYSKSETPTTLKFRVGSKETTVTVSKYTADYVNGGTGSNWISMRSFEIDSGSVLGKVSGNNYVDLANDKTPYPSLIAGDGTALAVNDTPGVVVNLSTQSLWGALAPLIRTESGDSIVNYGLVSGLSDNLSARVINSDAIDGIDRKALFKSEGLGAGEFAFYANDGTDNYAVGKVVNIQNVQGSNDASNLIVGGASNGILQGGVKADIIVGGTGNSSIYGMGGNDLLVSTVGNDTLYAGQFGHLGPTTPAAAVVTNKALRDLWNGGAPTDENRALLGDLAATTFVAGTGVVNMVGSDVGNDYFLLGKANNTIYGSGLGANGLGAEGTAINAADHDTLSFAQIGTLYYKDFSNLTLTITYTDAYQQSGTAVATYTTSGGSIATLFNTKFFDIEHFVFGSARMIFRDTSGNFYYDPIDPGFTGGTPGTLNSSTGLITTGPATSTVTGNNPTGGNLVMAGGGGNTNFVGGGDGTNPNTLDFSSNADGTYYDCEDTRGITGNVRNYSLVLDLINAQYSYQQDINSTPTVYGGSVSNFQHAVGTVCCSDILVGKADTFSLTGGGGLHNIIYAGGGTFTEGTYTYATTLQGSWWQTDEDYKDQYATNGGAGYNWVVFQNPLDLIKGSSGNGSGVGQSAYTLGVTANLDPMYSFDRVEGGITKTYTGDMLGFANILGTAGNDIITGDENDNVLVGGNGDDTVAGGGIDPITNAEHLGGKDILYGGAGKNTVRGLAGNIETFAVGYNYNPAGAGSYWSDGSYGPDLPGASIASNVNGTIYATIPGGTVDGVGVVTASGAAADDLWGWNTGRLNLDSLYVSTSGSATVRGFDDVDTDLILDFSKAQNLGEIKVTAGDGNNTIYGSSGVDHIVAGNGNNTIDDTLTIDDWNHASGNYSGTTATQTITTGNGNDTITVKDGHYLIRSGNGNDTITAGDGDNVIIAGDGNNTITVGDGVDNIYAGAGVNLITLGQADQNADNIYIYNYTTRNEIYNFESGTDKIYFDVTVLRNMGLTAGNLAIDANGNPILGYHSTAMDGLQNGQDYETGNIGILSGLYDAVYRASLGGLGADNGAWTNNEYRLAYTAGVAANSAVIIADFAIANALSAIPIVGPIIAIPFFVLGGLMIYDTVGTKPYENRVYNTNAVPVEGAEIDFANPLLGFANNLIVDRAPTASGDWTTTEFMSFYNYYTSGGFKPSLEVTNGFVSAFGYPTWYDQTAYTTRVSTGLDVGVSGIHTIALLHTGDAATGSTYIYVVNSSDNLIQDSEARLFAKVNGHLTINDLDVFDASEDETLNFTPGTPPTPPAFVSVAFVPEDGTKLAEADPNSATLYHTNATSGTLTFTFAATLVGNTLTLVDAAGNVVNIPGELSGDGLSVSYDLTGMSAGPNRYSLSIATSAGFESDTSVMLDVTAPPSNTAANTDVQVSASSQGITVSSQVESWFSVWDDSAEPVRLKLDTETSLADEDGYVPSFYVETEGGKETVYKSVTLVPTAQDEQAWVGSLVFKDSLGDTNVIELGPQLRQQVVQETDADGNLVEDANGNPVLVGRVDSEGEKVYDSIPYLGLGTLSGDTFDVSDTATVGKGYDDADTFIYGFGGADSVTANATTKFSTTFIAGDDATVEGANGQLNVITADANGGFLLIDLTGSDESVDTVKIADGAATVHSDGLIAMRIAGFEAEQDKLQFTGDTTTSLATGTATVDGLILTASNGIVSFTGADASTTLDDFIDAVESLIGTTDGKVAAFDYFYTTVTDVYDLVSTSATYGQVTGTKTTEYHDLIVVHAEGAADAYSVVQLVGVGANATDLADFVSLASPTP